MPAKQQGASRRDVLRSGVTVSLISGLAGCSSLGGGDDNGEEYGPPVELEYVLPSFINLDEHGRMMADQWSENLGVTIERDVIEWETFTDRVFGDFDFNHLAYHGWIDAPERLNPEWFFGNFVSDGLNNSPRYSNEEYDSIYSDLESEFDEDEQNELIKQLQAIVMEDVPYIEYIRPPQNNAINTTLWDIQPTEFLGSGLSARQSQLTAQPQTDEETLIIGTTEPYARPNPLNVIAGTTFIFMGQIYDVLRRVDTDGTLINWAVTEFETVDDTTLDLTLREGMEFHDGEPVTASDLAFSFNTFIEHPFPTLNSVVGNIEEATVESDNVVRVHFEQPDAPFLFAGAIAMRIIPEHIWGPIVEGEDEPLDYSMPTEEVIGSGPFEVVEMTDQLIHVEANEDHWAAPNYEEIRLVTRGSAEAIRSDIEVGNIHQFHQDPGLSAIDATVEASDDVEFVGSSGIAMFGVTLNTTELPTSDRPFRQALRKSLNPSQINEIFWGGTAYIPNGSLVHPRFKEWGEDYPTLSEAHDVDDARNTLAEAGYQWDDEGQLRYPAEYDV